MVTDWLIYKCRKWCTGSPSVSYSCESLSTPPGPPKGTRPICPLIFLPFESGYNAYGHCSGQSLQSTCCCTFHDPYYTEGGWWTTTAKWTIERKKRREKRQKNMSDENTNKPPVWSKVYIYIIRERRLWKHVLFCLSDLSESVLCLHILVTV